MAPPIERTATHQRGRSTVAVDLRMEPMSAKSVHAIALVLAPCRFWYCAKTFHLEKLNEIMKVFSGRAGTADAPVLEGNERPTDTMIEMFAGTEERPSEGMLHLWICELHVRHLH